MCDERPFKTITAGTIEVGIYPDYNATSPREEDNLGVMVCWHSRHNLGDERPRGTPDEWREGLACSLDPTLENRLYWWDNEGFTRLWRKRTGDDAAFAAHKARRDEMIVLALDWRAVILPLYIYEHGGITMNTGGFSDPWDSGQVGYIYMTYEVARENWGWKRINGARRKRMEEMLRAEVAGYDQFLTGDVWGYIAKCDECDEELDSCWGYFGLDEFRKEARDIADHWAKEHNCTIEEEETE